MQALRPSSAEVGGASRVDQSEVMYDKEGGAEMGEVSRVDQSEVRYDIEDGDVIVVSPIAKY